MSTVASNQDNDSEIYQLSEYAAMDINTESCFAASNLCQMDDSVREYFNNKSIEEIQQQNVHFNSSINARIPSPQRDNVDYNTLMINENNVNDEPSKSLDALSESLYVSYCI